MAQIPCLFVFFLFLSCALYSQPTGTKTTYSASYGKERTPPLLPTGAREKAINPSLYGMRPTARQPRKIRNQTPTKRAEQENQTNTRGGINRKTLAVDTNNKRNNCYKHYEARVTDNERKTMGAHEPLKTIAALRALLVNPRR